MTAAILGASIPLVLEKKNGLCGSHGLAVISWWTSSTVGGM